MTDVLKRKKATRNSAIVLPLLALLGACTNSGGIDDAFTTASIGRLNIEAPGPHISNYSIARSAPVSEALVKPAAFGAKIVQVSQTRFSNGLSQKIVLEGKPGQSGENWMRVSISDGRKTGGRPDVLIVDKPTSRSVAKQLRAHFPR
ncbi:MAG: cellulose biosynthesis protein BcsN, partial [Pseudomonadota bacterium]